MPKLYFYDTSLAGNLLRLTTSDDVYDHYLRGGLFESMILSDLMKKRYHHGLPPNLYFWRDKTGLEVDGILEEGNQIKAIEIKSTETIQSDLFEGLIRWSKLADIPPQNGMVIYCGSEEQKRSQGNIISWKKI